MTKDMDKAIRALEYRDGWLYWKDRPREDFPSNRGYALFKTRFAGKRAGTPHCAGYWQLNVTGTLYLAHRVIWEMHYGPIVPGMEIDHINGNRMDNRIENLRLCTRLENAWNMHQRKNPHGLFGVGLDKRRKKRPWNARILINNKCISLGVFKTKEEAHAAYMAASRQMRGEFHPRVLDQTDDMK